LKHRFDINNCRFVQLVAHRKYSLPLENKGKYGECPTEVGTF